MLINIIIYKTILNLYSWFSIEERKKYLDYVQVCFSGVNNVDSSIDYSEFLKLLRKDCNSIDANCAEFSSLSLYKRLYKGFSHSNLFISLLLNFSSSFLQVKYYDGIKLEEKKANSHVDSFLLYQLITLFYCLASGKAPAIIYTDIIDDMLKYTSDRSLYLLSLVLSEKKYNTSLFISGKKVYSQSKNNLFNSFDIYSKYLKAKSLSYDLSVYYESHIYIQSYNDNELEAILSEFYIIKDKSDYFLIAYYYLMILLDFYYYKDKIIYSQLISEYSYLLAKLKVFDLNRSIEGNINLVMQYLYSQRFIEALDYIETFQSEMKLTPKNEFALLFLKSNIFLYQNNLERFNILYNKILSFSNNVFFTNYKPLLSFLYANYCHLKADYKQSILSLQEASSLISDKSGYGLGIRILEIMNFIRWGKDDQMENALINLKNQITFLKKSGTIKPRFIFIYKILVKLHSSAYDYNKCYRLFYDELKLMASSDLHWSWDIRSPEVIRFDTWFFQIAGIIPDWNLEAPTHIKNPDA
jgi:hypothetical protein